MKHFKNYFRFQIPCLFVKNIEVIHLLHSLPKDLIHKCVACRFLFDFAKIQQVLVLFQFMPLPIQNCVFFYSYF